MNQAQKLLWMIGGTASLVAGAGGHWYADHQTPKKKPQRPRSGRGAYGKNLMAHFDDVRLDARTR